MRALASTIRVAVPEDAAALATIHAAAWRSAYAGIIPYRSLGGMIRRHDAAWWESAIKRGAGLLVAEFEGVPFGYASFGATRTGHPAAAGEIYELYLLPHYQGIGFGRQLFAKARAVLRERGLSGLLVWALAENTNALAFYRGLGGREIGRATERFETMPVEKIAFVWR
ncbi:GNAT family N-acetyltransferase [Aureimonas psammosilenae]|uniref:GNAT family N-acetyltransferase n=1 Tax=Aureimonas psammosilenae TaxID=2495496 RepID=UPI00126115E4|nr:GNAT family N-acetyltransferase [Aureimonas psammosilenae]